jgi:hypothetical protein
MLWSKSSEGVGKLKATVTASSLIPENKAGCGDYVAKWSGGGGGAGMSSEV